MADPQGRLHALRGSRLPQGLSRAWRDCAIRQWDRRLRQRELHRLRLLHQGLPVQHSPRQPGRSQIVQMHALLRPRHGWPRAGLREGLPDRRDHVRLEDGHDELGGRARNRPQIARIRECGPVRSARGRRHACDVCPPSRRPAIALCRSAGQSQDQHARRGLEGRVEAAGGGRRRARRGGGILPLDHRRSERGAARGRHRGGEAHSGIWPQKVHGRRSHELSARDDHSQYDGGAHQSLDHRRLLRVC